MIVEQVVMRTLKIDGGVTGVGRLKDSVSTKLVRNMVVLTDVCNGVEGFCSVTTATSEQHVDARDYRITRDVADLQKLSEFFIKYYPFPETTKIMSVFSGVVGDDSINCHKAFEIGKGIIKSLVGQKFGIVKLPRKNKVLTLKIAHSSVKVNEETVAINPLLLLQRISTNITSKDDMKTYLQYELAPFPLSIFTESGFRKNTKSDFYNEFNSIDSLPLFDQTVHVVDGGFLLHRVPWQKGDTVEKITNNFLSYVIGY